MLIISDLHGAFYTLTRLLNQCAVKYPGEQIAFGGDLIDRGPHSRQVVEFAMENKIPTVAANHDDLCLAYSAHARRGFKAHCAGYYERDIWLYNGGEATLANWPAYRPLEAQGAPLVRDGEFIPDEVLRWMEGLPAYIIPDAPRDANGRQLLLSHTGYGLAADKGDWFAALWGRHPFGDGDFPVDNYHRVFGHSQQKMPIITPEWSLIDTGAAYAARGLGTLTAFHWPSKAVVQQSFDETPVKPRFRVAAGCISA